MFVYRGFSSPDGPRCGQDAVKVVAHCPLMQIKSYLSRVSTLRTDHLINRCPVYSISMKFARPEPTFRLACPDLASARQNRQKCGFETHPFCFYFLVSLPFSPYLLVYYSLWRQSQKAKSLITFRGSSLLRVRGKCTPSGSVLSSIFPTCSFIQNGNFVISSGFCLTFGLTT